MVLPDYHGGSIVNLMSSIIAALGGDAGIYPPLRGLDPAELASPNVVLIIIDGLGYDYLRGTGAASGLAKRLRGKMTSVFPSTTATAITTFLTGVAPQQHGLTGWHMYFRELGSIAAVLPFRPRYGGSSLREAGVDPVRFFRHVPIFDQLNATCSIISPQRIVHSDFNAAHSGRAKRYGFASLKGFFERIGSVLRLGAGRRYVYAYYPEIDSLAHQHGAASEDVAAHLAQWDLAFAEFLEAIRGTETTVIVTADHGFIDSAAESHIELETHPRLAETLTLPLSGERRVAYCYVHAGKERQFEDYVASELSEQAMLYSSEKLLEGGWFGLGEAHPGLRDRIGDYTLVMKDRWTIKDWIFGEHRHEQIGVHGGVSDAEMHVPLIIAKA
jgi:arylsulfatase A-like enzyme